jgi:GDP-L-fucose synthase
MRKLMDSSRLTALGWSPRIVLAEGIRDAYAWYLNHHVKASDPAV